MASTQQSSCDQGLFVVIRDMSAQLAVDRMMIQQLQKVTEEQADELKELDSLKKQLQVKQVAFSASLLASGSGFTGSFNTFTTLLFKNVVSNIGNAYSPDTGLFTAPVRGAYHFEFFIYVVEGHSTAAVLVKNGQRIFAADENQSSGQSTAGNAATLLLEKGDVVCVQLWPENKVYDNENHHTTFSGHLLFPMTS